MVDHRTHGNADLLVVSARTDLRWLEWLVLCVSADGRGDDAFFAFAGAKAKNLRSEELLRLRARSRDQRAKCHKEREKLVMPRLNVSQSHNNWSVSTSFSS